MTAIEFNTRLIEQKDSLTGFALSLTKDTDDALDLTQDTLLKALLYKDSFSAQTNFKAWLFTIMKNTFINAYNRSIKGFQIKGELSYTSTNHTSNADSKVLSGDINRIIDKLKAEYRLPFQRFIEGFKYHEIAEELQLPIGTVKSRIFTARKKISKNL